MRKKLQSLYEEKKIKKNMKFYLDACIWLNLFKKEGDTRKGTPYWKIAEEFIEKRKGIIVSTIVIKEIAYKAEEKFGKIEKFFIKKKEIDLIKTKKEDYELARRFEQEESFKISFYDYLHVAIAKRTQATLITRDRELLRFAKKYISAYKPEELLD